MKKIAVLVLAIMLVSSMTLPAYAYDGNPGGKSSWLGWFSWWEGFGFGGSNEPAETQPVLAAPEITDAKFYHTGYVASLRNRLQIEWEEVDGAESYEVEVTKADGTKVSYTASAAMLMVKNTQCPKVYVEETATWTAATVRVRAVSGSQVSGWSDAAIISCDKMH